MIGSVDGIAVPVTDTFSYAASKAGVHMLGRQLAHHLHRDQITVNSIAPGPFDSKMMAYTLDPPESREIVRKAVPLRRIGEPTDMAGAVIYLCSKAGSYLTGAVIPVDGGLSTHG
jgi:NAD(P)-dependent dehydrogenase (short-subunit alcohol dehydrogenase family)